MKYSLKWTANLSKTVEKENFKNNLSGSKLVLDRLKEILDKDLETSVSEASSRKTFDIPNWSEYQAYLMGKQAYINQLKDLLPNYED